MPRYRITVEYDGRGFVGWQRQENGPSVQAALEEAIFRFCGEKPRVYGAGRTDAGVHALGQVAHFDLTSTANPKTIRDALNFHLRPAAVVVLVAVTIIHGHVVSPAVLISGVLPLGAAVAMFNAIVALMNVSHLEGEALSGASVALIANMGKVFTTSLAIALGLGAGMAIVRLFRREEVREGV